MSIFDPALVTLLGRFLRLSSDGRLQLLVKSIERIAGGGISLTAVSRLYERIVGVLGLLLEDTPGERLELLPLFRGVAQFATTHFEEDGENCGQPFVEHLVGAPETFESRAVANDLGLDG